MGSLRAQELLNQARDVGLEITTRDGKLVIRGPRSAEWLVREIREYREEILLLCTREEVGTSFGSNFLPTDTDTTPKPTGNRGVPSMAISSPPSNVRDDATPWNDECETLRRFVLSLTPADLPPAPFRLHPWADVLDTGRYLAWLQRDVAMGPKSPRARYGVLRGDMERLREFVTQHRKDSER